MRCLTCGAEMQFVAVAGSADPDFGLENHTFKCSVCGDTDQRLAFIGPGQGRTDPIPLNPAPPDSSPAKVENENAAAPSVIKRIFATLSGVYQAVIRQPGNDGTPRSAVSDVATPHKTAPPSESASLPTTPPTSPALSEPVFQPIASPTLVLYETDDGVDECEALLRQAKDIVRSAARAPQAAKRDAEADLSAPGIAPSLAESDAGTPAIATSLGEAASAAPSLAASSAQAAAPDLVASFFEDWPEASASATSLAESRSATADTGISMHTKSPVVSPVEVKILYDPARAKYAAKDIKTGLIILRNDDEARLRAMCGRMRLQVVADAR